LRRGGCSVDLRSLTNVKPGLFRFFFFREVVNKFWETSNNFSIQKDSDRHVSTYLSEWTTLIVCKWLLKLIHVHEMVMTGIFNFFHFKKTSSTSRTSSPQTLVNFTRCSEVHGVIDDNFIEFAEVKFVKLYKLREVSPESS
jgi:hypothetical protein